MVLYMSYIQHNKLLKIAGLLALLGRRKKRGAV